MRATFLMMGTQVAFISASADALRLGGASLLATLVIASSLVQVGFSRNLSLFRRLITPQIAGTMMMLIAVTIMPILFDLFDDVPTGADPLAAPASALTTLALIAGITLLGKDAWQPWSAVTGDRSWLLGGSLARRLRHQRHRGGRLDRAPIYRLARLRPAV